MQYGGSGSEPSYRRRLFDEDADERIQQLQRRRVQFNDEATTDNDARRRHSLKADLSGTKYDISQYHYDFVPAF